MEWSQDSKAIVDITFGIIIAFINICQTAYLSMKNRRNIYETILLSLSIADLLFGLSNFSIGVAFFTSKIHEEVFEVTVTTYFFFILTSLLHLSWIAIDRFWAVHSPIKHNYKVTKTKVNALLVLTWTATTFVSLFLILHDELIIEKGKDLGPNASKGNITAHISRYQETMETTLSSFIVVIDVVFIVAYSLLIWKMSSDGKISRMKSQGNSKGLKNETKIVVTCLLISASFVCFTLPFAIVVFVNGKSNHTVAILLQLNSASNSIIYFLRNKLNNCGKKHSASNVNTATTPRSTPTIGRFSMAEQSGNTELNLLKVAVNNNTQ